MFAVIIAVVAVFAAIIVNELSRVAVSNAVFTVKSHKIEVNVRAQGQSIASVVKAAKDWSVVDTSVEEYSAEAVNVVITSNGVWKMTRVVNKNVKFSGRTSYTGKASGWLFVNTTTGNSDMLLEVNGESSVWEARNWFGNGNFAVNTKVVVK